MRIALEGGKHWGASDQSRYDAWARKNQQVANNVEASGVPDGLDPEGVRIALEGGKHWGATDQARYDAWAAKQRAIVGSQRSEIQQSDGDGIKLCVWEADTCIEGEKVEQKPKSVFTFKAYDGKAKGVAQFDVPNVPFGASLEYSQTGNDNDWQSYDNKKLITLNDDGEGFVRVVAADNTLIEENISATVSQFNFSLDEDVIDVQHRQLEVKGAVPIKDTTRPAHGNPNNSNDDAWWTGGNFQGYYRYPNLFPDLNSLGYSLEGDVHFKATDVKAFIFDNNYKQGGSKEERFEPIVQEMQNGVENTVKWNEETEAKVDFKWAFYLREDGVSDDDDRRPVNLVNFWLNPVDLDSNPNKWLKKDENDVDIGDLNWEHAEFVELPGSITLSDDSLNSDADVIYTLPKGVGHLGEKGPAQSWWNGKGSPDGGGSGKESLIRQKGNRFLGAQYWTVWNSPNNEEFTQDLDLSNERAGSVQLDYVKPVGKEGNELVFSVGNSGQINANTDPKGNSRFFSISMGDNITDGGGIPVVDPDQASVSIEIVDYPEFELAPSGSCETEEGSQIVRAGFELTFKDSDGNNIPLSEETTFKFTVSKAGVPDGKSFVFEQAAPVAYDKNNQVIDGGIVDFIAPDADGNGTIVVQKGVDHVAISNEYVADYELTGNEQLTLSMDSGYEEKAATTTKLDLDKCPPPPPELENEFELAASGSCETEEGSQVVRAGFTLTFKETDADGNKNDIALQETTTYTFGVSSSGVPEGESFAYEASTVVAYDKDDKEIDDGIVELIPADAEGQGEITVKAGVWRVAVTNEYEAKYELSGNEQLTLSLSDGDQAETATTTELDLDKCPPPPPELENEFELKASGSCETEEGSQVVRAGFTLTFKETDADGNESDIALQETTTYTFGVSSSGVPEGESFAYEASTVVAYDKDDKEIDDGIVELIPADAEGQGEITVKAGVWRVAVTNEYEAKYELSGNEQLTLSLSDESQAETATTTKLDLDKCPPPPPKLENEFELAASGSCETEEGSQVVRAGFTLTFKETDADGNASQIALQETTTYTFGVSSSGVPAGESFAYEASTVVAYDKDNKEIDDGIVDLKAADAEGQGEITVKAGVWRVAVTNEYEAKYELSGNEQLTLSLSDESQAETATTTKLDLDKCPPPPPELENEFELKASGSCETEEGSQVVRAGFTLTFKETDADGNASEIALQETTTYTFNVSSSGVPAGESFAFEAASIVAYGANGKEHENGVRIESGPDADGNGTIVVEKGVDRVEISNEYVANYELTGNEQLTLSLSDGTQAETATTTKLDLDKCPPPPPELENEFELVASGSCETEEGSQVVRAGFTLTFKETDADGNESETALKETTTFTFNVSSGGVPAGGSFDFGAASIVAYGANGKEHENGVRIESGPDEDGNGTIVVEKGVDRVEISNEYVANYELTGSETITLSLSNGDQSETAITDQLELDDCPPVIPPLEIDLDAEAACVVDGELSDSTAEFVFRVDFVPPPTTESIDLDYVIEPSDGLIDGDYGFHVELSDGVSIKEGGAEGVLEVDEGVSDFTITITASAADSLKGDEEITLTLNHGSEVHQETASLAELDCAPEPGEKDKTDVQLYLLMDNSTSMLQPDPSTTGANRRDRLESQDRVSLYAYQVALEKAGYGFSRKGESGVLSTPEFEVAVINNSAADLSNLLNDFEVVVNPDSEGAAEDLTVHLITYGYAVDYGSVQITAADPSAGTRAAQAIVGVLTPDQIYGNSIEGNRLWADRKLPTPTSNDTFRGEGRPASNLYSGTEMMGALEGLEHLLSAQAERGGSDPITTYISMTTDGRPERRAWWDTRKGPGSDSLTGQEVRLPEALGGDAITTSGLLYDAQGNHIFLRNNVGNFEWLQTQSRLNDTLDAIADQAENAETQLQVSVVGMGDGTDADFPAIYADLFGERTFDPSKGGWDYDYFTSYALPDFVG